MARHVIGDQCSPNSVVLKLPDGEPRALQEGAGFVGEDVDVFARGHGGPHHSERGAVARGGQRSGVAMGQDAAFCGQQRSAVGSHGAVGGNVLVVDGNRLVNQSLLDERDGAGAYLFKTALHAADGPEEIHGRRAGLAHQSADLSQSVAELRDASGRQVARAEGNAHGGGHSNGRSATHNHGADGIGHFLIRAAGDPELLGGELGLVNEKYAGLGPLQGF